MADNQSDVIIESVYKVDSCSSAQIHNSLFIDASYLGIFGNVSINLLIFLVCIIFFAIIRDKSGICGILPLDRKNENERKTQNPREAKAEGHDYQIDETKLNFADNQEINQNAEFEEINIDDDRLATNNTCLEQVVNSFRNFFWKLKQFFNGFWFWIRTIFQVSDEEILRLSGQDAIYYLSFQRYLILFCGLLTVVCMVIVFPVNFLGNSELDYTYFGFGTINNLDAESPLLWIHLVLSISLFPISIAFMRKFSLKIQFEKYPVVSRTLMFEDIPKEKCNKNLLRRQFQEAYPGALIEKIELAYNFRKLIKIDKQRKAACDAVFYLEESKRTPIIYQYAFCQTAPCCCCCQHADAVEYYTQRARNLTIALEKEELTLQDKPLRIGFVTFQSEDIAYKILQENKLKCSVCKFSKDTRLNKWNVSNAPMYEDIYWENLSDGSTPLLLLAFLVNFILFAFFFLWTTPLNILNSHPVSNFVNSVNNKFPMVGGFLSTLLMWNFVSRMPIFVSLFEHFVFHWSRSREKHIILFKTLWIQLFMVIILPTLEFNNTWAFLTWLFTAENKTDHLLCVYMANSFAFYLNYVITSTFVGSVLDLIRPSQLMRNIVQLSATTSEAERYAVRKTFPSEFHFGGQYAWFLPVFAVTVIYSISCPIIAPFGLLYMCMQHGVDRHNILFVHKASKINKNIHATAINFVIIATLLAQFSLSFFMYVQRGATAITIVAFVMFGLTALVFIAQFFLCSFHLFNPIKTCSQANDKREENKVPVVPNPNMPADEKYLPRALFRKRGNNPEPFWWNCPPNFEPEVRERDGAPPNNEKQQHSPKIRDGRDRENRGGSNETITLTKDDPTSENELKADENSQNVRSFRQGYESLGKVFTISV